MTKVAKAFIAAKRLKTIFYEVKFSMEKREIVREYSVRKRAVVTFLGVPFKLTKEIYVPAQNADLEFEI